METCIEQTASVCVCCKRSYSKIALLILNIPSLSPHDVKSVFYLFMLLFEKKPLNVLDYPKLRHSAIHEYKAPYHSNSSMPPLN